MQVGSVGDVAGVASGPTRARGASMDPSPFEFDLQMRILLETFGLHFQSNAITPNWAEGNT